MNKKKRTSIQDIAKAANVSIATVSRVLNSSAKVRPATAKRVLKAKDKLGYHPNHVARRMRVKSSDSLIIGLILTDIGNPFFSELSRGVEDIAYEHDHAVLICNTDEDPEKEKFYINSMLAEKVSGLIMAPSTGNIGMLKELKSNNYPIICVDRYPDGLDMDTVTIDNQKGAYLAVKRLIELGHRRIAIVNGIKGLSTTTERLSGYQQAHNETNMVLDDDLILFKDYKESGGREAMHHLLSLSNPPTAIFSTNNLMTLGCLTEMHNQNIIIPDDIAIIGFDDMPWSMALNPSLTAVRQPGYKLGLNAVKLLLKRIDNIHGDTMHIVLNSELIIRKSCGSDLSK